MSGPGGPETPNGNIAVNYPVIAGTTVIADDLGSPLFPTPPSSCMSNYITSATDYLHDIPYQAKPDQVCAETTPAWNGSSGTATYTFTSSYIPVCTNFFSGSSNAGEFCGGIWVLSSIKLPDNTMYSFSYDSGTDPGHYGTLSSITWPTGGITSFAYRVSSVQRTVPIQGMILLQSVTEGNDVTTLNYSASPGSVNTATANWYPLTVTYPAHQISPQGQPITDSTTYTLSQTTANGLTFKTLTRTDSLNNTLVSTTSRDYTDPTSPSYTETTWNESGHKVRTEFTYAGNSQISYEKQSVNGSLYRTVHTTFQGDTASIPYASQYHMLAYPSVQQLLDASNHVIAQTTYTYDEYGASFCNGAALTPITGAIGHDDSRGANWYARGNPTTVSYTGQGGASVTTHKCYDTLGNVTQTIDGNGHATQFSYADAFSDTNCLLTGSPTYALPTTVTDALSHTSTAKYNSCVRTASTNKNGNDIANSTSGTTTTFDVMGRSQCVTAVDSGQSCTIYTSGSATSYQMTQSLNAGSQHTTQVNLDAYGQPSRKVDQSSGVEVDTTYGTNGLLQSQTNPFASTGSTSGTTSYFYDGKGRLVEQQQPDGAAISHSYIGLVDTFTDEASHAWTRTSDPLGRLSSVSEPIGALTTYTYDERDNLTGVTQAGVSGETARTRQFKYDALSRLLWSTNPESGTVCYGHGDGTSAGCNTDGYDGNSNLVHKTDATGATVDYTYDALNRITSKKSSQDAELNQQFTYDSGQNEIGRLSSVYDSVPTGQGQNGASFKYDAVGRIAQEDWFNYAAQTWQAGMGAQYDLAGNITQLTYPDGRKIKQDWDSASRLQKVSDPQTNYVYFSAVAPSSVPPVGFVSTPYWPSGSLANATLGGSITEIFGLNSRLQPTGSLASTTVFPLSSSANLVNKQVYYDGSMSNPVSCPMQPVSDNGNIYAIVDNLRPQGTQVFSYDQLNRLNCGATPRAGSGQGYTFTYDYDSFGNMLPTNVGYTTPNYSREATNRLQLNASDLQYDAAGRLTQAPNPLGGAHTFGYTAEGNIRKIDNFSTGSYLYNGLGERTLAVRNDNGSGSNFNWDEYVYLSGQTMAHMDYTGLWTDYIYANGQKIARAQNRSTQIHFKGTNCSGCGQPQSWAYGLAFTGYTVQQGDQLAWRQMQTGPASPQGGIGLRFNDGSYSNWVTMDQNGEVMNSLTVQNSWVARVVDLSPFAGKSIAASWINEDTHSGAGDWEERFGDMALIHSDGSVMTIYNGEKTYPFPGQFGYPGVTNQTVEIEQAQDSNSLSTVKYYLADQVGTTQEELSAGGWPLWQGLFTPFGQEVVNGAVQNAVGQVPQDGTSNPFKFTGKERDQESGLDYFGARYYASSMGRFSSPDPSSLAYADPTNPQSLNLYSYVQNNPLKFTDPSGMACVWDDGSFDSEEDQNTGSNGPCSALGGTWLDRGATAALNGGADWSSKPDQYTADAANTAQATVSSGPNTPLSGSFDFGTMTRGQFVAMMRQSGIQVSFFDTSVGIHPGLNLRGSQSQCSIHVALAPFAGQYGNPTTGTFHIDEYNPWTVEPPASGVPLDVNGGGMQPTPYTVLHMTQDVIPDIKIAIGKGTWTGNQNCPR